MKKSLIEILVIGAAISIFLPVICATPVACWHNSPKTGDDIGDTFILKFEVSADETANYTVSIDPGTKFSVVDGNNSITFDISKDETRTFIFNMKVAEKLEDGKYPIYYNASKNWDIFKSDKAYVRAGVQAPGFEIIAFISAVAIALIIWRKKGR